MPITDWPAADRPREKLLQHGAQALTDAELLALFLRIGVRGKTAVDLARELLTSFGGLNRLFATPRAQFVAVHGMGDAKYAQLQAVLEMARRALGEGLQQNVNLATPAAVKNYLILGLGNLPHEVFCVLFLDAKHGLIASEELLRGTAYLIDEPTGRGHVILFAEDPNFRFLWRTSQQMFMNSVLLAPSLR